MATAEQRDRERDDRRRGDDRTAVQIGERVLQALGRPDDLFLVQARPLWGDFYRVNVLVGPSYDRAKIAHSFFLSADRDGNILGSTPALSKRYPPGD